MEARKCKLCGTRHWGMCPDLEQGAVGPAPTLAPTPTVQGTGHISMPVLSAQATVAVHGHAPKSVSQDRTAYMRAYMQRYRAEKKGMVEPAPQKLPFDKAAYMRDYMPRWRAARKAKATPQ